MSDVGEKELKNRLLKIVQDDFIIKPEVKGKNLVHKSREVQIDYMFYPKQHLINAGFDSIWFGVEVKHFGDKCDTEKMSKFIWQNITYVQSEFQIEGNVIRPTFVLGYSDVEKAIEFDATPTKCASREWFRLTHLAGLANAGIFGEYTPTKNHPSPGWYIRLSTSTWFYKNQERYKKDENYNIYKVNVGNCFD